jgi:hypothetical protein
MGGPSVVFEGVAGETRSGGSYQSPWQILLPDIEHSSNEEWAESAGGDPTPILDVDT